MKSDKGESMKPPSISIPQKDAIAIVPPKRVSYFPLHMFPRPRVDAAELASPHDENLVCALLTLPSLDPVKNTNLKSR